MLINYSETYKDFEDRGIIFTGRVKTTRVDDTIILEPPNPNFNGKGRGDWVVYLGEGGWPKDKEFADKHLEFCQPLQIEIHEVGDYSSLYIFKEYPNLKFNSVLFE